MAFCSFSKDTDNAYTVVENKFITKFLPEADGFAVKVYLYGLYLCENSDAEFTVTSMAEVLQTSEEKIKDAFSFWEDYDLVEILCKDPFTVQYLPVKSTEGRPKRIRYERYADFNKELQRKMQKVGKFISAGEYTKYMRFLEENAIQPEALLLVAEYCIHKQGEAVTPSYVFNKAKKLIRLGHGTYEQVEKALSNYNANEGNVIAIFNAMSIYQRVPDENDYALYAKWTENYGFKKDALTVVAKHLQRGTFVGLNAIVEELFEKGKLSASDVETYLTERNALASLTYRIGRKLGVKIQNPTPYIEEYVEKWRNYGFEESSLLDLALFCLKTERASFNELGIIVDELFQDGIIATESVKDFLKEKNDELKLLTKIQAHCGSIRKTSANLSLIRTWRAWEFSDEMIVESAKRSSGSSNPVPYMNKILSSWKHGNIRLVKDIPENFAEKTGAGTKPSFVSPAIEAVNAKSARERYYAILREKAQALADRRTAKANENPRFKEITLQLSKMEMTLAKAEIFEPQKVDALKNEKTALLNERKSILSTLGINEAELSPQYVCKKCSDTGFMKNGVSCTCYKPEA